jgi:hypothetical protein
LTRVHTVTLHQYCDTRGVIQLFKLVRSLQSVIFMRIQCVLFGKSRRRCIVTTNLAVLQLVKINFAVTCPVPGLEDVMYCHLRESSLVLVAYYMLVIWASLSNTTALATLIS